MSILNVEHLTHGFGDRAIFNDVSFRLLKGEHTSGTIILSILTDIFFKNQNTVM